MPDHDNKWRARLFTNGKSQAVRLPKALRFQTDEVLMWREGDRIILEAAPKDSWPEGYWVELDELAYLLSEEEPMNPAFLDLELD